MAACSSSVATPATSTTAAPRSTTTAAPGSTLLEQAVANTLNAPNFSEVLTQNTSQGKEIDHLVFQAPDRVGGYILRGSKRTYVYVIGTTQYQSQSVPSSAPTTQLTFHSQTSQSATA